MTALLRSPSRRPHAPDPERRSLLRAVDRTPPVRPVRPAADRRRLGLVLGALLFALALAGNVSVHTSATQGQFDLERLRTSARQKETAYQQLRLRVAEMEAPQRIVDRAHQMGMIEPAKVTYLTPTAKTSIDDPAAAKSDPVPPTQAVQRWGQVKQHLAGRP